MSSRHERRYRMLSGFQKRVYNRILGSFAIQPVLETKGRKSGLPRQVPVSGRLIGENFWFVSEFGERSDYVRNIQSDPQVRVRLRGTWHSATARLLHDDDALERLRSLPKVSSLAVKAAGTDLLTVCVTLDDRG